MWRARLASTCVPWVMLQNKHSKLSCGNDGAPLEKPRFLLRRPSLDGTIEPGTIKDLYVPLPNRNGQGINPLWHFYRRRHSDKVLNHNHAYCQINGCMKPRVDNSRGSTKGMIDHLRSHHALSMEDVKARTDNLLQCVFVDVCMRVCMYVRIYPCLYVCLYVMQQDQQVRGDEPVGKDDGHTPTQLSKKRRADKQTACAVEIAKHSSASSTPKGRIMTPFHRVCRQH